MIPGAGHHPRTPLHARIAALAAVLLLVAASSLVSAADPSPVTLRGTLVGMHGDDFVNGVQTPQTYKLQTADGLVDLEGPIPGEDVGREVEVRGELLGSSIRVAEGGVRVLSPSSPSAPAAAITSRTVAVILINFTNDTSQPYSPAFANGIVFTNPDSVAAFYAEESYGQLASFTGTVYGWYTINYDSSVGCD
jgi:hypothetical protein